MKRNLYILLALLAVSVFSLAQSGGRSIVDDLNSSKWGQGDIKVLQDEAIQSVVAIHQTVALDTAKTLGTVDPTANYTKVKGFKIQVYSGNNQQRSKRDAESRQAQVRGAFPDLEAVVSFHSPVWRLRVGNFLNRADAENMLLEMKRALPGFGREMIIVPDVVKKASY